MVSKGNDLIADGGWKKIAAIGGMLQLGEKTRKKIGCLMKLCIFVDLKVKVG